MMEGHAVPTSVTARAATGVAESEPYNCPAGWKRGTVEKVLCDWGRESARVSIEIESVSKRGGGK